MGISIVPELSFFYLCNLQALRDLNCSSHNIHSIHGHLSGYYQTLFIMKQLTNIVSKHNGEAFGLQLTNTQQIIA
jgi:hypothetical protein